MVNRIAPAPGKEPQPAQPPAQLPVHPAAQSARFTPAVPLRQSGKAAAGAAASPQQCQKPQRAAHHERASAALAERAERTERSERPEQFPDTGPVSEGHSQYPHLIDASGQGASEDEAARIPEADNGESGKGGSAACRESQEMAAARASIDMEALAEQLMPHTGDNGIFEVTLPDGKKIGVAVNIQPGAVRFHLSPNDEKLGERLQKRKMELQGHLERRIQRNVDITVL